MAKKPLDQLDKVERRESRKKRRQERRARIADLLASMAGTAFGTKKIGWAVVAVIVAIGGIVAWKMM